MRVIPEKPYSRFFITLVANLLHSLNQPYLPYFNENRLQQSLYTFRFHSF